jgi:hypothetical protein
MAIKGGRIRYDPSLIRYLAEALRFACLFVGFSSFGHSNYLIGLSELC